MNMRKVQIQALRPDDALRVGDFSLLPVVNEAPVITSHPIRNFYQETWSYPTRVDGKIVFKPQPIAADDNGVYTIRKNTQLSWGLYCTDPSNINNPNDISNLTFLWKKDGQPLHSLNRQNDGRGSQFVTYTEEQCTEEIDGTYICEVSNNVGTTTSTAFTIRIIDINTSRLLYTNLLINGDGKGGLDGWINPDGQIKTTTTIFDPTLNQSTLTQVNTNNFPVSTGSNYVDQQPFSFRTNIAEGNLFYGSLDRWIQASGADVTNVDIINSNLSATIPGWVVYGSTAERANIIPNEDYGRAPGRLQGFYPGIHYIDRYNRNKANKIRLQDEFYEEDPLTYFGRKDIAFKSDAVTRFYQEVNVDSLETMIDGFVGGVEYLTAQFFSYVGCAISRYTIRTIQGGEVVDYNYMIHDLDTIRGYMTGNDLEKIAPDPGSVIEIIPHTDDTTTIEVSCIGQNDEVLKTQRYDGPTALDLWAIREKVDWSLTLYPLFAFFKQNDNPIQIFGKTYTTTTALAPLFNATTNGVGNLKPENVEFLADQVSDINAKFILKRYGYIYWDWKKPFPGEIWEKGNQEWYANISTYESKKYKAYVDKGVSAFFAVGGAVDLPKNTKQVTVSVNFTNSSPARSDESPEANGWNDQYIYNSIFNTTGNADNFAKPYYKYGTPRCGVTKMKLTLVPNRDIASPDHTTYAIPPAEFTTLGLAREAALGANTDASKKTTYKYVLYQPEGLPPFPQPTLISKTTEEIKEAYKITSEQNADQEIASRPAATTREELEAARTFARTSTALEDLEQATVDFSSPSSFAVGPSPEAPNTELSNPPNSNQPSEG